MAINTYLSIITFNGNGLNALVKRPRWLIAQDSETLTFAIYEKLNLD